MNRRRFLTITAAAALCAKPASANPARWTGRALGADAQISIHGLPENRASLLWPKIELLIEQLEADFSLYRSSTLTRLNQTGHIANTTRAFQTVVAISERVNRATGGVFDPSVQPLWRATAQGTDLSAARALVGWGRVASSETDIRLGAGMALTFNGIAQGFAADVIAEYLFGKGFHHVLVDMGEVVALAPTGAAPWPVTIAGPQGRALASVQLQNRALATSSPAGTLIGKGVPHIMHPDIPAPLWNTVSVSAPGGALADALSTAFCLMDRPAIDTALAQIPGARLEHIS